MTQLQHDIAEIDAHTGYIVHEIRNSLQVLLLPLDSLESTTSEEDRAELEKSSRLGMEQLKAVFTNVFKKERTRSEDLGKNGTAISVREQMQNLATLYRAAAFSKKLSVNTFIDSAIPTHLVYDAPKINQILSNLVSNSIKFTQKGGIIIVAEWKEFKEETESSDSSFLRAVLTQSSREQVLKAYEENDELGIEAFGARQIERYSEDSYEKHGSVFMTRGFDSRRNGLRTDTLRSQRKVSLHVPKNGLLKIQVIDTGIGIKKEQERRLFREFAQANEDISARYGGTGLGLWGSKSIIQKMGGDINVESEPGRGCNIILAFPATIPGRPTDATPTNSGQNSSVLAEAHKWTVFLVDERELSRKVLLTAIRQLGFVVREYSDIRSAIQAAATERPRTRLLVASGTTPFAKTVIEQTQRTPGENGLVPVLLITDGLEECQAKVKEQDRIAISIVRTPVDLRLLTNSLNEMIVPRRKRNKKAAEVLFASSDTFQNTVVRQHMKATGVEVVERRSQDEALAYYRAGHKDIGAIIYDSDVSGSEGTGAWLERVRNFEAANLLDQVAIVLISKEAVQPSDEQFAGLDLTCCLKRPVNIKELKAQITTCLSN